MIGGNERRTPRRWRRGALSLLLRFERESTIMMPFFLYEAPSMMMPTKA